MAKLKSKLSCTYSSAAINYSSAIRSAASNVTAAGESEVAALFSKLRDPDALKELWESWRLQAVDKEDYLQLLRITNKASKETGTFQRKRVVHFNQIHRGN